MFWSIILVLHIVVCLILILSILLQTGKGADIGAVFGGGSSQTVFGSAGPGTFLSKLTIAAAVVFMCTSIGLSYFSGRAMTGSGSIVEGQSAPAPAKPVAPVTGAKEGAAPKTDAAAPAPAAKEQPAAKKAATPSSSGGGTGSPAKGEAPKEK